MDELPVDQVRTLLAAVDEGTFDAAARALRVTPSAVSQRVKALERRTGRVLVQRSKPIQLTGSGEVVVRFARQLALLEREASTLLGGDGDGAERMRISIAVNADSLETWFLPALQNVPETVRACFDLLREDQDHTADLLRRGSAMAAVTTLAEPVQGCTSVRLGRMRYRAMAHPAFVERWFPHGATPRALDDAPVIVFDRKDVLQDQYLHSRTRGRARGLVRHSVPSSAMFLDAVVRGLGWGMVPEIQASSLADGSLVDLDPGHPIDVPLYWQQWKLDSPALAAIAAAVAEEATRNLHRPRGR